MKNKIKKVKVAGRGPKPLTMLTFALFFAAIGVAVLLQTRAATGNCSTANVIGTATYTVSAPETAQYRLWVRMQVPDATNTNNLNGVRVEIDGNQCFVVTTTSSSAVNQWQWINSDATATATAHITSQLNSGSHSVKIFGLRAGVNVDKVLLLKQDNTCVPSNTLTNGQPGDNCTTSPPNITFTASSTSVTSGGSATLNWSATDTTSCTASDGWTGTKASSGSQSLTNLTATKTYTLTCTGAGGSANKSVTITVTAPPAPTLTFSASPTSVVSGSASTLTWSSSNATSCTASDGWTGTKVTSGSESTGNLTTNKTYALSCTGAGGTINKSVSVTVTAPPVNDTTPPGIVNTIPGVTTTGQTDIIVNNQKGISWQPLASDQSGIKSLTLTINNQPATLVGGAVTVGQTANGDYILKAVAVDNANNTTTTTLTVRIRHPDFNRSGKVDATDMTFLLSKWSQASVIYDINNDGKVGVYDLTFVLSKWNSTN
jgi:hypothetical protein